MIAALFLALAAQVPTFEAASEVVNLWVNVRDHSGAAVTDLRKEDFVLLQDGASVPIELFGRQGEAGDDSLYSLNLGLLFDVSASMVPAIAASRASALAFLDSVPNAQDMTVTMFDHMAQSMRYRPEDKERVRRWVEKAPAGGGSAVYAGVDYALNAMAPSGKRRVLVVLTDGLDESSALSLDALNRRLLAAGATVYVVQFRDGLAYSGVPNARPLSALAMMKLTTVTGGLLMVGDRVDPATVFARIRADIMSQYVLGFTPQPGKSFRKLQVLVRRKGADARHRSGYYPPGSQPK